MLSSNLELPTKACHNCRKRRWKCDRSLPVCHKCSSSGTECLGYGKLFVWAKGIASRGKMQGITYEESKAEPARCQPPEMEDASQFPREEDEVELIYREQPDGEVIKPEEGPIQWPLLDPLLNDLSPHSRYYIYHFATQLCSDLVIYDGPGGNPIRDLIPATVAYPSLLQIILANSAFHVFNIVRDPMANSSYQTNDGESMPTYYRSIGKYGGPLKSSYSDALVAKQQALSLLAQSITDVNPSNIDIVLTAILFFINYDLIESGQDKWRVHMEGARKLINLLGTPSYMQKPMSRLRTYVLSDLLV
jgi:hypothetical protein